MTYIKNLSRARRKLRRIDAAVGGKVADEIEKMANDIAVDMRTLTPIRTGNLVHKIDFKTGRDGLTAKIGVRTPKRAEKVFYFAFLDAGTKGQPARNIPPMPALRIRDRAFDMNKLKGMRMVRAAIGAALKEVTLAS